MTNPVFLIGLCFSVFCVWMASVAVRSYRKAKASERWPAAEGVFTEVRLWGTRNVDGEMVACEKLSVAYDYEVGGVQYSGSNVAFYQLHYPETLDFAKGHPQGSGVKVLYHPEKPGESVLVPGTHPTKPYGGLILAFFGVGVSVAVSVALWMGVL